MGRREPPELKSLKSVYDAVVKLQRHVEGIGRDVKQVMKRINVSETKDKYRSVLYDLEMSGQDSDEIKATFKNIAVLLNESEAKIEDMGYDINAIRSKIDQILEGNFTRDEIQRILLEDDDD